MKKVFIAQIAVATSIGSDPASNFQSLLNNKSGIIKNDRFDTINYRSEYAALIKDIESPENRSSFLNLSDIILKQLKDIPEDCTVLTATTKACIDLFEKHKNFKKNTENTEITENTKFTENLKLRKNTESTENLKEICTENKYLLPSNIPEYISEQLNLKNKGINISSACASSTIAIIKGSMMIAKGTADSVLIFCADVVSEFVFAGFSALNALSGKPAAPFDINRDGLTLGDGGAAILLVSEEFAKKNSIRCNTSIAGYGIASDANHIVAPARDGRGLVSAIDNALETAGINVDKIGAVNTHGTGTVYNDLMEITVLKRFFKDIKIPANSIKGSIGHTLGGSGGIEAALGTLMLKQGILPGTHGFSTPEKGAENFISHENIAFSKDYLLTTNSGFGGTNAALILRREGC